VELARVSSKRRGTAMSRRVTRKTFSASADNALDAQLAVRLLRQIGDLIELTGGPLQRVLLRCGQHRVAYEIRLPISELLLQSRGENTPLLGVAGRGDAAVIQRLVPVDVPDT
jgi:hypothetical protein